MRLWGPLKMRKSFSQIQIRLISDVHLEPALSSLPGSEERPERAEAIMHDLNTQGRADPSVVLILAGDIGDSYSDPYRRFLLAARAAYHTVILVPGNHDYYTDGAHDMGVVKEHLARLAQETGVTLLDNSDIVIRGFRFVGSTCWPIVPEEQFKVLKREHYGLVTRITKDSHRLDPSDFKRLHDMDVKYLEETVRSSREPCVVITHYPPSAVMLDDAYEHSAQIALHYNEGLIDRVAKTQEATPLWCCGHTHTSRRYWVRGMNTLLVSNCVEGGNYDKDFSAVLTSRHS